MNNNSNNNNGDGDSVHLLEKLMAAIEQTQKECDKSAEMSSTSSIIIRDNFHGVLLEIERISKLIDSIPGADTTEEEQKENLRAAIQTLKDQETKFMSLLQNEEE